MPLQAETVIRWIERHVSVQNVKAAAQLSPTVPFTLNRGQREFVESMRACVLIASWAVACKSRQVGLSTLMLAWELALCVLVPGITCGFVAPDEVMHGALAEKFSIIWRSAADSMGSAWPGVTIDNAETFKLGNGSRIRWIPSGKTKKKAAEAAIGETMHFIVLSELASYPFARETIAALEPALQRAGACVVVDSTPPQQPGLGDVYLELAQTALQGHPDYDFYFWPWWLEKSYRSSVPAADYTPEESILAARHSLDPFQVSWRRQKKASPTEGKTFPQTYPETPQEALSPRRSGYAFDEAVIATYMGRPIFEYPAPFTASALWPLVPDDLKRASPAGDLFFMPKWEIGPPGEGYVRVWRAPVPGVRYYLGVDPSDGLPHGDWQTAVALDQWGNHCATARTRIDVPRFAALVERLSLWYGTDPEVELSRHGGPAVVFWLAEELTPAKAAELRAWGLERSIWTARRTVSASTSSARISAYLSAFNGGRPIQDPDLFIELTTLDPETGRCARKRVDHDDYLDGYGIAEDARLRDAADEASSIPRVSIAPRKLRSKSLAQR
jgi:hypothetical protein